MLQEKHSVIDPDSNHPTTKDIFKTIREKLIWVLDGMKGTIVNCFGCDKCKAVF